MKIKQKKLEKHLRNEAVNPVVPEYSIRTLELCWIKITLNLMVKYICPRMVC